MESGAILVNLDSLIKLLALVYQLAFILL